MSGNVGENFQSENLSNLLALTFIATLKFIVVHNDPLANHYNYFYFFPNSSCHAHTDTINMRIKLLFYGLEKKLQQFNR